MQDVGMGRAGAGIWYKVVLNFPNPDDPHPVDIKLENNPVKDSGMKGMGDAMLVTKKVKFPNYFNLIKKCIVL